MNSHINVRAYLAGIAVPTMFLLVILTAFCYLHFNGSVDASIERLLVFPMAVVPNLWGLWNILYVAVTRRWRVPLGLHGVVLPFLLAPLGYLLLKLFGVEIPDYVLRAYPIGFSAALAVYYLAWKYAVGYLNAILGIAA
jgi:hypothetical protein